jgi:hypothetical protein
MFIEGTITTHALPKRGGPKLGEFALKRSG